MASHPQPGDTAPPLVCGILLGGELCLKEATWHFIFQINPDDRLDNGLACDKHKVWVIQHLRFLYVHEYKMECSMPGAIFLEDLNICVVDEEGLGLPAIAEALEVTEPRELVSR